MPKKDPHLELVNPEEIPTYIPAYTPEDEKLPTLKQWIKKNQHEEYKFDRISYPVAVVWAPGEYGTASVVTNEFRIVFKCSEAEFSRLIHFITAITDADRFPVCKVDRDSSPGWSITGSDKSEKGLYPSAIEKDERILGYGIRRANGSSEF
jgi:hypothetical protein